MTVPICQRNICISLAGDVIPWVFNQLRSYASTSFPRLQCEDEARHEEALVWAGYVSTQKMAVFDSHSSRSGEIFFNEIYETNK
jgi:hypothetical protein